MSTLAPQQTDRAAWLNTRTGKFTASTMADLMGEARGKGPDSFGQAAMELIRNKATERVTGHSIHTAANFAMKRGTLLEFAATFLLSRYWQPVYGATWMPIGTNAGATPDFLDRESNPGDIKCPESEAKVYAYADAVPVGPDGFSEWSDLLEWSKDYAYQIATQALACDTEVAWLVYFSDKIKGQLLTEQEREDVTAILEGAGHNLLQLTGQIYDYEFGGLGEHEPGFAFVARKFRIPAEELARLKARIAAAEVVCAEIAERYSRVFDQVPTVEEVEAVSELIEDADIETEEAHDIGELEGLVDYLLHFPPMDLKTAQAQHTMGLVRKHLDAAVDMITGTINKDLK